MSGFSQSEFSSEFSVSSEFQTPPPLFHQKAKPHRFYQLRWPLSVLEFSKGKIHFFQKCSKIGLVAKKMIITFRGGGSEPKVIIITLFLFFFNPSLSKSE